MTQHPKHPKPPSHGRPVGTSVTSIEDLNTGVIYTLEHVEGEPASRQADFINGVHDIEEAERKLGQRVPFTGHSHIVRGEHRFNNPHVVQDPQPVPFFEPHVAVPHQFGRVDLTTSELAKHGSNVVLLQAYDAALKQIDFSVDARLRITEAQKTEELRFGQPTLWKSALGALVAQKAYPPYAQALKDAASSPEFSKQVGFNVGQYIAQCEAQGQHHKPPAPGPHH